MFGRRRNLETLARRDIDAPRNIARLLRALHALAITEAVRPLYRFGGATTGVTRAITPKRGWSK